MIKLIFTAVVSFIGTNIDDIFVLTFLFGAARRNKDRQNIFFGQVTGMLMSVILAFLAAEILISIDTSHTYLLGIIPVTMGLKEFFRKEEEKNKEYHSLSFFSVLLIALADGGDNIGVYMPLFAHYTVQESMITIIVFVIMMMGVCYIAGKAGKMKKVHPFILRYSHILVPTVLLILGFGILLGGIS